MSNRGTEYLENLVSRIEKLGEAVRILQMDNIRHKHCKKCGEKFIPYSTESAWAYYCERCINIAGNDALLKKKKD